MAEEDEGGRKFSGLIVGVMQGTYHFSAILSSRNIYPTAMPNSAELVVLLQTKDWPRWICHYPALLLPGLASS